MANRSENKKVAIYLRVSTKWQIDKDSLQVQRRELTAYSEMILGIKDYEIFEDPGYSGKDTDRPEYQRMMGCLRTGNFSHLLVWKIDRISRNLLDFASMYNELKSLGVTFVSKNEQFDTSSAVGEAMLKIILVFAELERNMTSERVTAVMFSRAANGQWNGGRPPYGYIWHKDTKTFTIDEEKAKVVKTIYDHYMRNHSILDVSRLLNSSGIPSPSNKEWDPVSVSKILKNPFYIGQYVYKRRDVGNALAAKNKEDKVVIEDHHIPIISKAQFDRVAAIRDRNQKRPTSHLGKNVHVFAGMVRCGMCGSNMSASKSIRRANGWAPTSYICAKRRSNSAACSNKYISDVTLGPFVLGYISNIMVAHKKIDEIQGLNELQAFLLRGKPFENIERIGKSGLSKTMEMLKGGSTGIEYKPDLSPNTTDASHEMSMLVEKREKNEKALIRLRNLFLYGDSGMSEDEYNQERSKILEDQEKIEKRLNVLTKDGEILTPDEEEFVKKGSCVVMIDKLMSDTPTDFSEYFMDLDPSVVKDFVQATLKSIEVLNSRITKVTFLNGVSHKFIYKQVPNMEFINIQDK